MSILPDTPSRGIASIGGNAGRATASALASFHRELKEGGIPDELAYEIVRDAARELVAREGLCVKAEGDA